MKIETRAMNGIGVFLNAVIDEKDEARREREGMKQDIKNLIEKRGFYAKKLCDVRFDDYKTKEIYQKKYDELTKQIEEYDRKMFEEMRDSNMKNVVFR